MFGDHYYYHLTICLCSLVMPHPVLSVNGGQSPHIIQHPNPEIAYKELEPVQLACVAQGHPEPQYFWEKDGVRLEMNDSMQLKLGSGNKIGSGNLIIANPSPLLHDGIYQCFAYNDFGVAVTTKAVLKKAELRSFPSVAVPTIHRPEVGAPLTLNCSPPHSYPRGVIYWGENSSGAKLQPMENTARVSLDYSGSLHFSNIVAGDELHNPAAHFLCAVYNPILRSLVQGEDQRIEPQPGNLHFSYIEADDFLNNNTYFCIVAELEVQRGLVTGNDQRINPTGGSLAYRAPALMWPNSSKEVTIKELAIKGETKKMKCIFSGYPTPMVTWSRVNGSLPSGTQNSSFGQEIIIPQVSHEHAGRYRCSARNGGQSVAKEIELVVESGPFWRQEQPPKDVTASEDDDVEFECIADGRPAPNVSWSFNGRPYNELMANSRQIVSGNKVKFLSVTKNDSQVLQCNASNVHGYILKNAFLRVRAEPPSVLQAPENFKVAEGQNVIFVCRMEGAPKPAIEWTRESKTPVTGERFQILPSGDLEILDASVEDTDTYHCNGTNKLGVETVHGQLIVRNRTLITVQPQTQIVNVSSRVRFVCKATTDRNEMSSLTITWYKDGHPLDHTNTSFLLINDSLIIDMAQVSDTGDYKCLADNKVDSSQVTVQLTVRDRPQAPTNVRMNSCTASRAEISWTESIANNDKILEYVVFYNTSYDPPDSYHVGTQTNRTTATVHSLQPWTKYTFHVTAKNSLGTSDRSAFTQGLCSTAQARPSRNPTHVCTQNGNPGDLVITWKPIPRNEHHGENFHYRVKYIQESEQTKDDDSEEEAAMTVNVTDWRQKELIIPNQGIYKRFKISVSAANDLGTARDKSTPVVFGHSSEGVPSVIPENFGIHEETLNSTSVLFKWDPVNTSADSINGFFKGFQVRFWKKEDPSKVRTEDHILHHPPPDCGVQKKSSRHSRLRRSVQQYSMPTHKLWGGATINAAAVVLNRASAGELSSPIEFITLEGVPEAVSSLTVLERGSHHLKLEWKPPLEINGILKHFIISYRGSSGSVQNRFERVIDNPQQTTAKIHDLLPETMYSISISAHTATGGGPAAHVEASTLQLSEPLDAPCIDAITPGEDFAVISWRPSCENPAKNPGSKFLVEYRTKDATERNTSSVEEHNDWLNLTGLIPGKTYEVVVVAVHPNGEKRSESRTFDLGPQQEPILQTSSMSFWLIPLILAILLFLLIIFLICCIKHRRQGKYPVYEKEKLHGCNPDNNDEEPKFGEYTKSNAPPIRPIIHGSLDSMEKPLESDTNSLAEYEDTDPTKFNEDGSFIGQYGGQKKVATTTTTAADQNAPFASIV